MLGTDRDLFVVNALAGVLVLVIFFLPELQAVRVILGVPFVLLFPGYALVCALFPKRKDLDGVERVALSIGLSLAVVPLIGLILNYTPWGIRIFPVTLSLFAFTLAMSWIARLRRRSLPPHDKFAPLSGFKFPEMNRSDKLMLAGLMAGIVVAGGLIAHFAFIPRIGERFTEFYILGPEGKIENYPTDLTLGESGTVIVGVANHEHEDVTYSVIVRLDNEPIGRMDGIKLEHGERWERNFTFVPQVVGERMKLEFQLYKEGENVPYRSLHLWISVRER